MGQGYEDAEMSRFLAEVPQGLVSFAGAGGISTAAPVVDREDSINRSADQQWRSW